MSPKGFLHVPLQDHWWEQDSWVSKFDCTHCSAWWNSAWFSIPGSVRPSNWIPLRSSDPGSRNHVQYIPTLVHDFRFLDQNAPRIVPPSKLWSRITKPCTGYPHSSAWFSIPGSVHTSNWTPLRSSDPGSRNHVQYIPTLVHDFRFLDHNSPRIVPPFEARIQDH